MNNNLLKNIFYVLILFLLLIVILLLFLIKKENYISEIDIIKENNKESNIEKNNYEYLLLNKIGCYSLRDIFLNEIEKFNSKQVPEKRITDVGAYEENMCYEENEFIDLFYSEKIDSCIYIESKKTICKNLMPYSSGEYHLSYDTYYFEDILNNKEIDVLYGVNFVQKIHRSEEWVDDEEMNDIINSLK